jgi:hypothetical protein
MQNSAHSASSKMVKYFAPLARRTNLLCQQASQDDPASGCGLRSDSIEEHCYLCAACRCGDRSRSATQRHCPSASFRHAKSTHAGNCRRAIRPDTSSRSRRAYGEFAVRRIPASDFRGCGIGNRKAAGDERADRGFAFAIG